MNSTLAPAYDEVARAVDGLAAEDINGLPADAIGDELVELRRQIDRLEAQFVRRLERFDGERGALSDGAISTASWLRHRCHLPGGAAADRVRLSRQLPSLPRTRDSFAAGDAGLACAALVARLAEEVGAERIREYDVEPVLVSAAEKLCPADMMLVVNAARHRLDPDGALTADSRAHERRWFACDQAFGGMFFVRGELDTEGATLLRTALDALSSPSGPSDCRTAGQRRADALVDLAARHLAQGDLPTRGGHRPHLLVTVHSGAATQATSDVSPVAAAALTPVAELNGGGPISVEMARRLACDAVRTVAHLDAQGTPLSIGRSRRVVPPGLRRALHLRDRGCRFPGCDRPPEWTDGHHIRHWSDGGATALDNLVLLCRRHHRLVHEGRWRIRLGPSGEVTVEDGGGQGTDAPSRERARPPTSAA